MWTQLKSSKKFWVMVVGGLAVVVNFLVQKLFKVDWPADTISGYLTALLAAFGIGQGIADNGKEAAKVIAASKANEDGAANPPKS